MQCNGGSRKTLHESITSQGGEVRGVRHKSKVCAWMLMMDTRMQFTGLE